MNYDLNPGSPIKLGMTGNNSQNSYFVIPDPDRESRVKNKETLNQTLDPQSSWG